MERLLMDKSQPKTQSHRNIQAFALTALTFNGVLTINFLRFNSTMRESLMRVAVRPVLDHRSLVNKRVKVAALITNQRQLQVGPIQVKVHSKRKLFKV